jgi:hypothetical protein
MNTMHIHDTSIYIKYAYVCACVVIVVKESVVRYVVEQANDGHHSLCVCVCV